MTVVGTVGHVDHGKTVLLRALTGIDADRLPEERRRGITIDVGYAHLALSDGSALDFVDLPGHHDLAGNLLVGAGEMDAALLVVAGDSGPETQTFEHLDVLSALGIAHGVVAVTKIDLIDVERRRRLLDEIGELLAGTALEGAAVVGVSGRTGEGLDELRAALVALDQDVRQATSPPAGAGHGRLPVDRAFRVRGHGLVATGTLRGGRVALGDELWIVPGKGRVRVRGIQVHGHDVDSAAPGGRVAVNLAGVEAADLRRGVVLTRNPGVVATERLLVTVEVVPDAYHRSRLPVTLHIATDHAPAALRWVGEPTAGTRRRTALLHVERPVAAAVGDRFLLRAPSPPRVLGGGTVLDPSPPRLRTRQLRERLPSAAPDATLATLLRYRLALPAVELAGAAAALGTNSRVEDLPGAASAGPLVLAPDLESQLAAEALAVVSAARAGTLTLAELRTLVAARLRRMAVVARADAEAAVRELVERMVRDEIVVLRGSVVMDAAGSDEAARLDEAEARLVAALDTARPPPLGATADTAGYPREALGALVEAGRVVRVAPDLAFAQSAYRRMEAEALDMAVRGELSAAAFRDAAGTSRRHAVAALDHMTLGGLLRRRGNGHELGPRAPARPTNRDGEALAGHGGPR